MKDYKKDINKLEIASKILQNGLTKLKNQNIKQIIQKQQ